MLAAMRRTSSQIPLVLSSFTALFRLQRWTELNHSSAGGRRGSGGLAMRGVMRALIARWVALIAMLDEQFHETTQLHFGPSIHGMRPFRTSHMTRTLETPD